jgi:FKBP-type peptidyl-prolyl cis-trans isomerase 2
MVKAEEGDIVKIQYTVTLENGDLIGTSENSQPLEFIVGRGNVFSGIEKNIVGMGIGDSKTIEIPPEEGFGQRSEELIVEMAKSDLPKEITPHIGQKLLMYLKGGELIDTIVTEIKADTIAIDANHPLAGHTMFCEIELMEISDISGAIHDSAFE